MTRKKAENEADFAKKNHIEEQYERAKGVDPKIWTTLQEIEDHYQEYSKLCKAVAQQFLVELMGEREGGCIHSARFRIKEIDSLLVKIIKKKAFLSKDPQENCEEEKYRRLDSKNYFKIVTDISGIRIIIRYREQWQQVHNLIWKYYHGDEYYLKDYINDYKYEPGKSFLAEKPKVYYRNQSDRIFYEQIGKDIFDFRLSDEGYNSIHYIINIDGKYIEVQVRTILDEAWSECTHDIVYKGASKSQKAELEYLSRCLSQQTIAAETITNLIYEKVNRKGMIYKKNKSSPPNTSSPQPSQEKKAEKGNVEQRIELLSAQKEKKFNGDINSLI